MNPANQEEKMALVSCTSWLNLNNDMGDYKTSYIYTHVMCHFRQV